MITPNLFPVIHPFNNLVPPDQLKKIGAESLFTNAFILFQNENLRETVLKKGIHSFLNYDGIIATDSGAFQQYIYDSNIEIKPEEIETFQEKIGSDFPVILDIPVQLSDSYDTAKKKIIDNINRAKENVSRRYDKNRNWIGPIHGGMFNDLLEMSAREMSNLDFALHAIGGLVKPFLDYRFKITIDMLLTVKKHVIHNRPLHMFGLGLPQFFSLAVACGCDLMDSAAYILYAQENRYFTLSSGTKNLEDIYEFPCNCPICSTYSPSELKKFENDFRTELIAKHNLHLSFSELKTIRQAIREGNLLELVETRIRSHPNLAIAYNSIKNNSTFIEKFERAYKTHGRLLSSTESSFRPIFYRHKKKLEFNYRISSKARFLILLPELDARGKNSPTIKQWVEEINSYRNIENKELVICFVSPFFGLIPIELAEIYPLGQHERLELEQLSDIAFEIIESFFIKYSKQFELIGILFPKVYINQFNEEAIFPTKSPIQCIQQYLTNRYGNKVFINSDLKSILEYIK